jgi:hypothetical protein
MPEVLQVNEEEGDPNKIEVPMYVIKITVIIASESGIEVKASLFISSY